MRQTVGSDTTHYLWDELSAYGDVVRETNGTGTELASYTLAGNQMLAQTRSGVTSYYLSDGQGSTRALLNGTGDLTDTYEYTAYGEIYNQTGSTLNNYLYTGQQFDSLTGLYSLRARYYDPGTGRFVSRDMYPINYRNPIELNRYGYVGNNPVNKYDPSGLSSLTELVVELFRFNEERAGISGVTGFTTGLLTSFVIYFGAASGMCGEEAKEWSRHVDPGKLVFNAAVGGLETGFIWGLAPPIITIGVAGYSIAVSAGSEGSGSQAPQSSFAPTISDSFCFLSQTAKYITDKMFELNEGKKPDTYKIAGFGAVAMTTNVAGPVVTQFPLGLSATETGAFISAGYTLAVGVVSGIVASMAAVVSAIEEECDPEVDEECQEEEFIYRRGDNKPKTVALRKKTDWLTGRSFETQPPAGNYIKFKVSDLTSHGYIVRKDGGQQITELFTGKLYLEDGKPRSFGPNHVTVYLPVQSIWDAWYEAEIPYIGVPNAPSSASRK